MDFERDLAINKFWLDEECLTHPQLYYHYSELYAEAKHKVGSLADSLKLRMGEANIEIRNRFIKKELKFTEAVINSEVEKDESVLEIREALRTAELAQARLGAAVSAFEHRKSQLDNLVRLFVAGYFSSPVSGGREKESIGERVSKEARAGLNRDKPNKHRPPVVDDEEGDE